MLSGDWPPSIMCGLVRKLRALSSCPYTSRIMSHTRATRTSVSLVPGLSRFASRRLRCRVDSEAIFRSCTGVVPAYVSIGYFHCGDREAFLDARPKAHH